MRPLYRCRACGFLSTLGSEFKRREGVLFDGYSDLSVETRP